jgi:tRNA nucleotidyltransferase (CCA-adding enzyme)
MSDYNFLLEIRLSPAQLQTLNYISRIASSMGTNLYLAGGAVRDVTLGQSPIRNLNFVTEGNVQKLFRMLQRENAQKPPRGRVQLAEPQSLIPTRYAHFDARRQEAVFAFANGVDADLTIARKEIYSKPGRPPEIVPAGIFEDLRQRDFTANAMAISLHPNSRGLLLDPTNGAADIENRELRALNNRGFWEDPSRIYRLLRLSLRLGFKLNERTQAWLESALEGKAWDWMRPEQQGRELRGVLQEENPARVFRALADRGLLAGLDPGLAKIRPDRLEKIRTAARPASAHDSFILNFDALTEKLSPAQKKRLAAKVIPDPGTLKLAMSLESEARKLARAMAGSRAARPSFLYQLLRTKPHAVLFYMLAHYPQARVQKPVKNFLVKFPQMRAKLPAEELQKLGVEPGPRSEKILDELFIAMLDGKLKSTQQITKALYELAGVEPEEMVNSEQNERRVASGEALKAKPRERRRRA